MADLFLSPEEQERLALRIASGDREAEGEMVSCFGGRVQALLIARTRDREAARDLFQETMLAAFAALRKGQLREPGKLDAFLQGTARNIANSHLRDRAARPVAAEITAEPESVAAPDPAESSQRDEMVQAALGQLGSTDREILVRTLVDGAKPGEIAQALGLSAEAVRQRKSRAVKKVAEYVQKVSRSGLRSHSMENRQ